MKISESLLVGDLLFNYTSRSHPSLGLIVSRAYGNSVSRNLFKRRCRTLFRIKIINKDVQVALIVRPKKQNISFIDMDAAFGGLYEKICT